MKPILFSTPMVQAVLNNSKTQTRRVIKPQPTGNDLDILTRSYGGTVNIYNLHCGLTAGDMGYEQTTIKCPYGQPGTKLWVRETWYQITNRNLDPGQVIYKADGWEQKDDDWNFKWRPSIHMPRWASRITLEIVNVSVERVQDISENDAWNEGVGGGQLNRFDIDGRILYKCLWDSINGKKYPWESNPFVRVIEFRKVEKEINNG